MSLRAIKYITSSDTLDTDYDTFFIDATGGNITFTLCNIENDGENFWIKRTDNSLNTVTIQGYTNTQTIENQTSLALLPGVRIIVISTNNVWYYF